MLYHLVLLLAASSFCSAAPAAPHASAEYAAPPAPADPYICNPNAPNHLQRSEVFGGNHGCVRSLYMCNASFNFWTN